MTAKQFMQEHCWTNKDYIYIADVENRSISEAKVIAIGGSSCPEEAVEYFEVTLSNGETIKGTDEDCGMYIENGENKFFSVKEAEDYILEHIRKTIKH